MGQIIDNLNNMTNIMTKGDANSLIGNKNSNNDILSVNSNGSDVEKNLGYKYTHDKNNGYLDNTTMKNFQEYLQNRQEKAKEAGQDALSEEKKEKENEKEVARNLSQEDIKRLKLMGVDIEGASMSDLLGMVNTMRYNKHKEERMEMMAQIAYDKEDATGITLVGGEAKINGVDLDLDVAGVSRLKEDESLYADKNSFVDKNDIIYLLQNNMSIDKDNLYKAHYSGTKVYEGKISEKEFEDMKPQIEKVIEQAGITLDADSLEDAKLLINNGVAITTDNIRKYEELKEVIGENVTDIINSSINESNMDINQNAQKLLENVEKISPDVVYDMAKAGKEVTIASVIKNLEVNNTNNLNTDINSRNEGEYYQDFENNNLDAKSVIARRQMEEIRLSMTYEVAERMTSLDVNIDTRELSKVVNMLRDIEKELVKDAFNSVGVDMTDENLLLYNEIIHKTEDIAKAPARILAEPLKNNDFSINVLHNAAITENIFEKSQDDFAKTNISFERVMRSYDSVGTMPRYDMGDSISKAFNNIGELLEGMDMPVNGETERAVRILGYNQIELTEENILEVINYDRQVNELIDNLYPEAVLGMIKDNINPLDTSIEELNKTLRNKRYNEGVTDAEDFASYLRDMEDKGIVETSERESYIGIYRMMNKLAKSGDREAGWLFANGSRLTIRNLLSAMRSRKSTGINVSIDDNFGMLAELNKSGSKIDEQIESAFKKDIDVSPDNSMELMDEIERFDALSEEVYKYIKENNIEYNMVNAFAVDKMLNTSGGIYKMVSEILADIRFDMNNKSKLVDEETENMTDSLSGEDIDVNPEDFKMDSILKSLTDSDAMSLKYEDLRNQITEMMYKSGVTGKIGSIDIATIKTINAGFNIMSKMAKNSYYQIPIETKEGINVINLSIERNTRDKGNIQINMSDSIFDNISARVKVMEDGSLSGYIVSDTNEGNVKLSGLYNNFVNYLSDEGVDAHNLNLGRISELNLDDEVNYDEATLYRAAVALVKGISSING